MLVAACGKQEEVPLPVRGPTPATSIPTPAPVTTGSAAAPATPALPNAPLSKVLAKADPSGDPEWTTEQFNEDAGARLGKVLMPYIESADADVPAGLLAAGFKCTALRPDLKSTFKDKAFDVFARWHFRTEFSFSGQPGFRDAIVPLSTALAQSNEQFHGKAKIVRVEAGSADKPWSTLVYFEANRGPIQQNAEWQCTWLSGTDSSKPLLESISLLRFEEIHASAGTAGTPVPFADCTEAVLAANQCWKEQLVYGATHWHGNLDVAFGIHQGNQGISIADTNGDGLEDVYICQPDGLPNRFFLQKPDGTLIDHSRESGLDFLDVSRCSLLVDLDNDGDSDCVLAHRFSVTFLENDGNARFTRRMTVDTDSRVIGLSAADYDNDGDLDIYVCGYSPMSQTSPEDIFANPVPYEDAHNGAPNYLFRNEGPFNFADATGESGLNENNTQFSFCAAWEDYDNDGDQDLCVANDFGRNNLYRNDLVPSGKPTFKDVAAELGVEDIGANMSVDWADADNDGNMDLYLGKMWSSAGNRITFQQQFKPGSSEQTRQLLQRHARGNSLFKNVPGQPFADVSESAGVTMGRWAWASLFVDLNNDGWQDIYVTNGFMSAPDTGDL